MDSGRSDPLFSDATKGHADVDDFLTELGEWLPEMLFDAVHAQSPSDGGFDGWGWNDFKEISVG